MGRLRICCLFLMLGSAVVVLHFKASDVPGLSSIALATGMTLLLIVTPFPAYDVASRSRIFAACIGYVVASALAVSVAISSKQDLLTQGTVILPMAGLVLTLWAFRTRKRRRVSSLAKYFQEN